MLKRFEKLQYMVIGAVLMAVGIGIGSIFTTPIVAEKDNVFDEITCRQLVVVGKDDTTRIILNTDFNDPGRINIYNENSDRRIFLGRES